MGAVVQPPSSPSPGDADGVGGAGDTGGPAAPGAGHAAHRDAEVPPAALRSAGNGGTVRTLVLAVLAVPALAALAFVVLGLVAGPPPPTVLRVEVAPWRTTAGDVASAAGFAITVLGLALMVRAGQVGSARRPEAAETVDAMEPDERRAAARAVRRSPTTGAGAAARPEDAAHEGPGAPDLAALHAARALALVVAARWTVTVLFAGLLLTTLGRAVVATDADDLLLPVGAAVVLNVLLVALGRQGATARRYLLEHPDQRTPPAVAAALAPWVPTREQPPGAARGGGAAVVSPHPPGRP